MITIPSGIKLKKEDVINAFEEEGYELLTYDFKKSKDKILVKCPKGHIDNINYDGFKQGKRCSTCKENKKYTYEFVYNYFLSQDCLLLSEEYINCKIPLEYQCSCGNKSKVSFDNFKSKNHRCKKCRNRKISESKKINYSEVKSRIELDKNELITKEEDYVDANNDIIIKCKCGIEFSTTFSRYKMRIYQNCPKCAFELAQKTHRRSEKEIKYILESYGLTLTDYNYVDNEHIVTFKCFCGNSETVNFNVFLMRIHKMCLQCSMEIRFEKSRQYSIEEIKPIFIKRNWQLLSNEFISVDHNLKCVCDKGHSTSTTLYRFINGCGCIKCFYEQNRRENHWHWKGGITDLKLYLREQLKEWKLKSFEKYNFQCILSNGNNKLNIHHLNKNFSEIVYEVLKTLNLKLYNSIGDYSFKALDSIVNLCLELHDKYGLGVPIESDLHIIFHKLYGKENNTSEQFEEFTKRYYAGEFN